MHNDPRGGTEESLETVRQMRQSLRPNPMVPERRDVIDLATQRLSSELGIGPLEQATMPFEDWLTVVISLPARHASPVRRLTFWQKRKLKRRWKWWR